MSRYQEFMDAYYQENYSIVIEAWNSEKDKGIFEKEEFVPIIKSFYKEKNYNECLAIYKVYHKRYCDSEELDYMMGWALYQVHIKNFNTKDSDQRRLNDLKKQVDYILLHCKEKNASACWKSVRVLLDVIGKGGYSGDPNEMKNAYLDEINPAELSRETSTYLDKETGKMRNWPSDQEEWYAQKIDVLFGLQRYDECKAMVDQAFRELGNYYRFCFDHDKWFKYKKAKCEIALGKNENAVKLIDEVIGRGFVNWSMYELKFEAYWNLDNQPMAALYSAKCALSASEPKYLVTFYDKLSQFLYQYQHEKAAMLVAQLAVCIRKNNGWKEKNTEINQLIPEEVKCLDEKEILEKMTPVWEKIVEASKTFYQGRVKCILPNGMAGFIERDDGKEYYFRIRDLKGKYSGELENANVKFSLVKRFDKKKGQLKLNAVDITIIE